MSYFLCEAKPRVGEKITLSGDEARHILLSRRMRVGEEIELQDAAEKRFVAEVVEAGKRELTLKIIKEVTPPPEPALRVTIFQSLIKEQFLDYVLQKGTELGAAEICLFNSEQSGERHRDVEKKLARWQKIAIEAAKQSGRVRPAAITFAANDEELHAKMAGMDKLFLLNKDAGVGFAELVSDNAEIKKVGIITGPEGGFTEDEVREFSLLPNCIAVGMGPRTLRADTAAVASLATIESLWGDIR